MSEIGESQDIEIEEEDLSRLGGGDSREDDSGDVCGEVSAGGSRKRSEDKGREKLKRRRIKKFTMSKKKNIDKSGEPKDRLVSGSKRKTVEPQIYDYFHDNFAKSKLKYESIVVRDWDKMISNKEAFF